MPTSRAFDLAVLGFSADDRLAAKGVAEEKAPAKAEA
jgi:hypothetical protein